MKETKKSFWKISDGDGYYLYCANCRCEPELITINNVKFPPKICPTCKSSMKNYKQLSISVKK